MKVRFLFLLLFSTAILSAQNAGNIAGHVTDADLNDTALSYASVAVKGTTIGTSTDEEGKYRLSVPPGQHTIVISYVGYEEVEVPVTVVAEDTVVVNTSLSSGNVGLEEVVVTANRSRQLESVLLLEQKNAVEIRQNIGAQELDRKGVGDVAGAVTKVTGISRQEGSGNIYVRGLGDRYNATTLNGLPLPSDNPSRKNINAAIFSTDIVEYIGIDKTYHYRNYGDFAGANIDIVSKNYKGSGMFEVGLSSGINSNAISTSNFRLQDGPGPDGFSNLKYPADPFTAYNFTTGWNTKNATPINSGISLKAGKSYDIGSEGKLGIFVTAAYDNAYSYNEGIARASVDMQGIARKDYNFDSFGFETNTTAMANLNYQINSLNTLKFNSLFVNSSSQDHSEYNGVIDRFDIAPEGGGFVRRSTFERTTLLVNQLIGEHSVGNRSKLNWSLSYNTLHNVIPDRMQNTLIPVDDNDPSVLMAAQNNESENHRYFQDLNDNEFAATALLQYGIGPETDGKRAGKLSIGYNGRFKNIGFEATQFNFNINQGIQQPVVDSQNIDGYFNNTSLNSGLFTIRTFNGGAGDPNALRPQTYSGNQYINAGFAAVAYTFSDRFSITAGIRAEHILQEIEWRTALQPGGGSSASDGLELLPTASLKLILNDRQNLKFAASKTYTLPQFKERAPFQYEEVTQVFFGNPDLYRSTNYNFDIRWESFPKSGELIAVTAFGKYIQDPINEVTVSSATNDISYVNTGEKAIALGAELEIRKDLFDFGITDSGVKNNLSAGFNASYMYSNQDFDGQKVIDETSLNVFFTDREGSLTGASDLLLNADMSWFKEFSNNRNIMATVAYGWFSDRLYAIGTNNRGNLTDKAVGTLDFIMKSAVSKRMMIGLSIKNLLNPTVERIQETQNVLVESYRKGISAGLSLQYRF
jgi:outer membrane receptor protein involved in Fe transport